MTSTIRHMRARARSPFVLGIWLALLLACFGSAFALDPSVDISQYAHTSWKVRDGFAKGGIYSIAQTPDGYLWLGTEFGLLRFDGVRANPWQPPGDQNLPPGKIYSLLATRDGTLWIGAQGLASWKNGKLTRYPELSNQFVAKLLEDREGTVWVGGIGIATPTGKLCAIQSYSVHCYGDDGGFGPGVLGLYEDGKGNLWAGVKDGLWRWKPGPPKFYSLVGQPDGIQAICEDADGTLLVGWKGGIYRFVDGKTEAYSLRGTSRQFRATKILLDRNGSLWVGTQDRGLLHLHPGTTGVFLPTDGLSGRDVYSLFEDREANIWVATISGLDRFRDFAVSTFAENQGLSQALVGSVLADKDGSAWLATYGGLNHWEHGEITIPRTGSAKRDGKLNGQNPNSLFQDDRGRIWVSTPREFGYLENDRFTSISGVPGGNMLSIVQDATGNLWVDNEQIGLFRVSPRNEVRQIPWAALGHEDNASVLAADRPHGGLWIGFFAGGVAYFADGQVRSSYTATDGLGEGRVSDFQFDQDGALWISTEGGLSRLKNNRVATLNSRNGLPCDSVHCAVEEDDRSLWLYTACGLVRIGRSELDSWAAEVDKGQAPTRQIQVTVFDSSDGVRSLSSPGHYHPQVAKTLDGKLWFLPWDGVSFIDPHHLPFNKVPPPVDIEQIIADRKTYQAAGDLRLPPRVRDLEIDYTALSLVAPEKNRFRYKLEGRDRDWQDVGNRRTAFYTDLPPRHYRFQVIASNNSGVWNEQGAALDFVIPPAWYQTNWFRSLCAATFLALLWAAYQLRVRQLAAQFNRTVEARVGERTRIARELHDTLLQSFHGLLLQFGTVSHLLQPQSVAKQMLDNAIDQAADAIADSRKTLQGLRSSVVESGDLGNAIRTLGEELAAANTSAEEITFHVQAVGPRRELRSLVRDEIYRIGVEALRNAFRHARAKRITVEIHYDPREFRLHISDDGGGIDAELLQGEGLKGHFGLPGMRERATIIGGKLEVWSRIGEGTEVDLTIPGPKAYSGVHERPWWPGKRSRREKQEDSTAAKGM